MRVRSREPLWLEETGLRAFFSEAFAADHMPDGDDAWAWCGALIENPNVALFVVRNEEMKWIGLAVCDWAESVWSPTPVVLGMYSTGREVLRALLESVREWGMSLGQEKIRFVNATKHSDAAYARLVSEFAEAEPIGGVLEAKWRVDNVVWSELEQ